VHGSASVRRPQSRLGHLSRSGCPGHSCPLRQKERTVRVASCGPFLEDSWTRGEGKHAVGIEVDGAEKRRKDEDAWRADQARHQWDSLRPDPGSGPLPLHGPWSKAAENFAAAVERRNLKKRRALKLPWWTDARRQRPEWTRKIKKERSSTLTPADHQSLKLPWWTHRQGPEWTTKKGRSSNLTPADRQRIKQLFSKWNAENRADPDLLPPSLNASEQATPRRRRTRTRRKR
jgi:hypothetical protein